MMVIHGFIHMVSKIIIYGFPLRLDCYSDGVYITAIDSCYQDLLGCRVLRICNMSIEEAVESIKPIVYAGNDFGKRQISLWFLVNVQLLKTYAINSSMKILPLELWSPDGYLHKVTINERISRFNTFWMISPCICPPGGEYVSIFLVPDQSFYPLILKAERIILDLNSGFIKGQYTCKSIL